MLTWLKRLFCKHEWETYCTGCSTGELWGDYYSECSKCGKLG